jgi:hypothetical protein
LASKESKLIDIPFVVLQQGVRVLPHQPAAQEHPGEGGEEDLPVCRRVLRREQAVPAGLRPGRTQFNILFRYLQIQLKVQKRLKKYADFSEQLSKNFHNEFQFSQLVSLVNQFRVFKPNFFTII